MGILRNLLGNSGSVKSTKQSPLPSDTDFSPEHSPLVTEKDDHDRGPSGTPHVGERSPPPTESIALDRTRTIRQVDYRSSSDSEAHADRLPRILRTTSDSPRSRGGQIQRNSPSSSSMVIDPPPYQSPIKSGSKESQTGNESPSVGGRREEQARIKGEKRARRRSAEGEATVGLGLGVAVVTIGGKRNGEAREEMYAALANAGGVPGIAGASASRLEAAAILQYQTTRTTTVVTTTTTTTQLVALPRRISSIGAPVLPALPPSGSPLDLSPSFGLGDHSQRDDAAVTSPSPSSSIESFHTPPTPGEADRSYDPLRLAQARPDTRSSTSPTREPKSHGRMESAELPPLPTDKSLPPIPGGLRELSASFYPETFGRVVPESIVVTPSTPARAPGGQATRSRVELSSPSRSNNDASVDDDALGRRGTVRAGGILRAPSPNGLTVNTSDSDRKLRHVRSLGIGIPTAHVEFGDGDRGRREATPEPEEVLLSARMNGSAISLSSGLSVSFGETRRPDKGISPDTAIPSTARSPSPAASLLGKLRGASQPSPSLVAAKSESGIQSIGRLTWDKSAGARAPPLRKAKSFSSFLGKAEKAVLREDKPEGKETAGVQPEKLQAVPSGAVVRDQVPQLATPLLDSQTASQLPVRVERGKLLRGPSSWFSGFRRSSPRDKDSNAEDSPIEMEHVSGTSSRHLVPPDPVETPTTAGPIAIPSLRSMGSETSTAIWSRTAHQDGDSQRDLYGGKSTFSPPAGLSSPDHAISPRSGSLGYFPSISEYSTTSSRAVSASHTPAVTPGIPDIITSSRSSSFRAKHHANDIVQSSLPLQDLPLPTGNRSLGGAIVFKRPDLPDRIRGSSDAPEVAIRGQSMDNADLPNEFGQMESASRPSLGSRSNSASSLALDRMKSIVSKTNGRTRSASVLRSGGMIASPKQGITVRQAPDSPSGSSTSMASTYGARVERSDSPVNLDSGTSSRRSSFLWHPGRSRASSTADATVLPVLDEVGQARLDFSPVSIVSSPKASFDSPAQEVASDAGSTTATTKKRRPRASTLFTTRPESPTHGRNSGSLFPPPKPSRRMSTTFFRSGGDSSDNKSPSRSGATTPNVAPVRPVPVLPVKQEGDEPSEWLTRLLEVVERAEVANVLASKNDPFFLETLQIFMQSFDFAKNALDVALRKLLMVASLPRETQQIDRVMDAFAKRYTTCHPGLFLDPDHAYVIAFSMIMLHTDAFNKNNKRKMTKQDYTRNTRLPGVSSLMLETFYDNTCYTPFRFIEDESQQGLLAPQSRDRSASSTSARGPKLDIYNLLAEGNMSKLKVNVLSLISIMDPISYHGSTPSFDSGAMRGLFWRARTMEVGKAASNRPAGSKLLSPAATSSSRSGSGDDQPVVVALKLVKIGLLSRKDDLADGTTKAANRKWRSWSVILTASQIIFVRESTWALSTMDQLATSGDTQSDQTEFLLPRQNDFRPEEVVTLASVFAVYDASYDKHANSFRLIMPQGRQYILQATDEVEMNEWIAAINWASAYKTSGIAMFGPRSQPKHALNRESNSSTAHCREDRDAFAAGLREDGLDTATIEAAMQRSRRLNQEAESEPLTDDFAQLTITGSPEMNSPAPPSLIPRAEAISIKVSEYRNKFIPLNKQVEEELRIARGLDILTPFEKATRDKIEASVPLVAAKIHRLRIQLAAYRCWIDVLEADLKSETEGRGLRE